MGGEKVILSIENGKYYNLGALGGHIWDMLKERKTVSQLIDLLMQEYEVDRSICEEQVRSFLSHLLDEKLILIQE
ncbi:Coenzyme PQQ synthesis protein D (PqqD) [compost metagenome]